MDINPEKIKATMNDIRYNLKIMQKISTELLAKMDISTVSNDITIKLPELKTMMSNLEKDINELTIVNKYIKVQ